jgi:RNA polymerase sigma-70 factor, ECF subfamily
MSIAAVGTLDKRRGRYIGRQAVSLLGRSVLPSMSQREQHRLFGELLAAHQSRLYGFLFALVGNREDANDLFQSTSLTLWQRFDTFEPGSNFYAWAATNAHFLARNFLKRKRLHSRCFNEDLLDTLAETHDAMKNDMDQSYLAALQECKDRLGAADRQLLDSVYVEELTAAQVASQLGRSRQSVCNSLSRIRRQLLTCIQQQMAREAHP